MKKNLFFIFLFFAVALMNAQRPIITRWDVPLESGITITLYGEGAFTYQYVKINNSTIQGEGQRIMGSINHKASISLPEVGEYILKIYPTTTFKFYFSESESNSNNPSYFKELSQWGDVDWNTNLSGMFTGCVSLQITATDIPDFSNVTSMSSMFDTCQAIVTIPNIEYINTSKVTSMYAMFSRAGNFNQDISNWDTSKVTNMNSMFWNAKKFNQNISNWDTSKVTSMESMFSGASKFNQNLGNWKLNNSVSLVNMFTNAGGMDCENYSKTLYGWAKNPNGTPTLRKLGASGRKYGAAVESYRNWLIQIKGWTITGDTFDSNCTFQLATSENENENFTVYPNPTNGIFNVHSKTEEEIIIYNSLGQILKRETLKKGDNKIDISAFPNGVYILQKENKTHKLIKK